MKYYPTCGANLSIFFMLSITPFTCWPWQVFFWKVSSEKLCPLFHQAMIALLIEFFRFLVYFGHYTFIGCTVYKYFLPFCRIYLHVVDCLLDMEEHFSLMQSHLSSFIFIACTFGAISKRIIAQISVIKIFLFFLLVVLVSGFIFMALIHSDLIFAYGLDEGIILLFCMCVTDSPNTMY